MQRGTVVHVVDRRFDIFDECEADVDVFFGAQAMATMSVSPLREIGMMYWLVAMPTGTASAALGSGRVRLRSMYGTP